MRGLTLAVLAMVSAFLPNIASARTESVQVIGALLASSGPPFNFHPRRVNILVTNLPTNWPARAGQCQTLKHEGVPKIGFAFTDGIMTNSKLVASGYALDGGKAGRSIFAGRTYIKLCRNAAGKPAAVEIQLSYLKFTPNNVVEGYVVYAENNGGGGGESSVFEGSTNFQHTVGGTAASYAVNSLQVKQQ